jgi:hypothetical protein
VDWLSKFKVFHRDNPQVYAMFKKFAFIAIDKGHPHLSPQMIFERIRWETQIETVSDDGFKVNDAFAPFYSRLFMMDYPIHAGFFRTRASAADNLSSPSDLLS